MSIPPATRGSAPSRKFSFSDSSRPDRWMYRSVESVDAVPGERRDRVQLPAHPGQVRQAQMPRGVGGEPRHLGCQRDPPDHLRPRPQRQRLGQVAPRLRQEQRPAGPAERGAVPQVLRQQHPGRRRVRHHPLPPGLSGLRPHPQRAVRRIEIVGAQRAQLLPAQRRVIGQREHHPVTDRLAPEHPKDPQPLGLGGDPRQLDHPRHQRPAAMPAAETAPGRIRTTADRVGLPQPLLDQEVIKQPHRHQPLLQRGVGRAPAPTPDPRPVSSSRRHYPAMISTRRRHAAQIPRN